MLKLAYESKEDIPEGVESFYEESDGSFKLKVEGVRSETDVKNVKEALQKERDYRREAEKKLKEYEDKYSLLPEDFNVEQYNELKDKAGGDLDEKLQEQRKRITEQYEAKMSQLQSQLSEKSEALTSTIANAELRKAMNEANIAKPYAPAVEAMMKPKIKVEGSEVFLDERPLSEALKEWTQTDDGKAYVAAPVNSGGGADGTDASSVKQIKRSDFEKMSQPERMETVKSGVKITN